VAYLHPGQTSASHRGCQGGGWWCLPAPPSTSLLLSSVLSLYLSGFFLAVLTGFELRLPHLLGKHFTTPACFLCLSLSLCFCLSVTPHFCLFVCLSVCLSLSHQAQGPFSGLSQETLPMESTPMVTSSWPQTCGRFAEG
jgi:hypothetical protein